MREALSKRTRSQGTAKTAARSSSRAKTASSLKRGSPRRATAAAPKRAKPAPATHAKKSAAKKSAATKKTTPKIAKPKAAKPRAKLSAKPNAKSNAKSSAKKALTLKAKPKPKVKLPEVKFKSQAKLKSAAPAPRGKVSAKPQGKIQGKGKPKAETKRVVSPPPPPPEPPRRQVASAVLRAFEHAVKVFHRRQFAEAKSLFESLHHRYPEEMEINARAQTYIHVCHQKLARPPASPRDADELYDRGVVALNIGDFTQARTFFEKALRLRPDAPHVLYSLAATHAQAGAPDQALDYLTRSIQMQPRFRTQAMNDVDFSGLREDKRFMELLGIASPFDLLESRH
jgi:tetratricopeptide (TPR) repeat protein